MDQSQFLFECMNNLTGVYNCETGISPWKFQYQNSILDKSDYFLNTQISGLNTFCANFFKNKIIISQYESTLNSQTATLNKKIETELSNFNSSMHYIYSAFCPLESGENPYIVSLASDNILRITPSQKYKEQSSLPQQTNSGNNILAQMAGMYS